MRVVCEQACHDVGQQHAARNAHRSLRRARKKAAGRTLWQSGLRRLSCTAGRWTAPEQTRQEAALGGLTRYGQFGLHVRNAGLCGVQGVLLQHNRLRHVIGRAWLAGDGVADQTLGFGVAVRYLAFDRNRPFAAHWLEDFILPAMSLEKTLERS